MAKLPLPQGGYDATTRLSCRQVQMHPAEWITVGDRSDMQVYRELVYPDYASLPHEPDLAFQTRTLYRHEYGLAIWHSDHIVVNDSVPEVIDYGWNQVYLTIIWTENPIEENTAGDRRAE